ncbi:hypothetical protein HEB94_002650 [Actinopolymorpha pittospori]|uniref:Uncharacterized protein n=1 Tax=Actinopolymorpha pittospori TaxID=648752 RepID=A0A927MYS7_9ACTN|nr:hypothetical protein [Actinopolymorpha pittospori]
MFPMLSPGLRQPDSAPNVKAMDMAMDTLRS